MRQESSHQSVRLSCIATTDAEPMLIRFLSGLEVDISVACHVLALPGKRGLGGGISLWKRKAQLLIEACQVNEMEGNNSIEIFTDIDIAVYRPFTDKLPALLEGYDILFQREWRWKHDQANIGVIVFRRNTSVRSFWEEVFRKVEKEGMWDQEAVNALIVDENFLIKNNLKIGFLPEEFWAYSMGSPPDNSCILHHANCATTLTQKWLQMNMHAPLFSPSSRSRENAFSSIVGNLTNRIWHYGELGQRSVPSQFSINNDGTIFAPKGRINIRGITITENKLLLYADEKKIVAVLDEFYIDRHRGQMLSVGRTYPKDFQFSKLRVGFIFMYSNVTLS